MSSAKAFCKEFLMENLFKLLYMKDIVVFEHDNGQYSYVDFENAWQYAGVKKIYEMQVEDIVYNRLQDIMHNRMIITANLRSLVQEKIYGVLEDPSI